MAMFDVNAVLSKADLIEYVNQAGGEVKKSGEATWSSHCPLHGGDNKTAFSIYHSKGKTLWHCFTGSCGGGDAISFVEKWQGFTESEPNGRRLTVFQQACEWILGERVSDPQAMHESAARRLEEARIDLEAAKEREEIRRKEFQQAERHLMYFNHARENRYFVELWEVRGIDEGMQEFWTLGGCSDFVVGNGHHTPTITIPFFDERRELLTISHRLINPPQPNDKYRPDRTGLKAHPFLAVPEMGYDGDLIWVGEGAIKAMVTWTRGDSGWQCIGMPGQEFRSLVDVLKPVGSRVIVVSDPPTPKNQSSVEKAATLAIGIGGRLLSPPAKMDDWILATGMTKDDLFAMSKQARYVQI